MVLSHVDWNYIGWEGVSKLMGLKWCSLEVISLGIINETQSIINCMDLP
jgi:hypothetical protein